LKRFSTLCIGVGLGVVLAASIALGAQGGGRGGGRGGAAAAPAAPTGPYQVVVIGCMKPATPGQDKDVIITDFREGGSSFHVDGSDERLAPWTRDTLEIHGTVDPTSTVSGPNPMLKLKADQVYVIARGCTLKPQS